MTGAVVVVGAIVVEVDVVVDLAAGLESLPQAPRTTPPAASMHNSVRPRRTRVAPPDLWVTDARIAGTVSGINAPGGAGVARTVERPSSLGRPPTAQRPHWRPCSTRLTSTPDVPIRAERGPVIDARSVRA